MIRDTFDSTFSLLESRNDPDIDGVSILGRVRGNFFFPEGVSRNNRFYPKELWENVLKDDDVNRRLQDRNMFGTIGHETALSDESLLQGKFSHFITSLSINEDQKSGTGEALILGTPAGKVLHTLLQAKCKLYVSSRADGKYKGEKNGIPIVDPDSYKLESFDFVVDPGFLEASPALIESIKEQFNTILSKDEPNTSEDEEMSKELIEQLMKEKTNISKSLDESISQLEKVKAENATLVAEKNLLKNSLDKMTQDIKNLEESNKNSVSKDSFNTLQKEVNTLREENEAYKKLGEAKDIEEAMDICSKMIDEKKEFEENIGTFQEVKEALTNSLKILSEYAEFGSPKSIEENLLILQQIELEKQRNQEVNKSQELADLIGAPVESVMRLVKKGLRDKEVIAFFESMKSDPSVTKFKIKENKPKKAEKDIENRPIAENRGSRLMGQFSR